MLTLEGGILIALFVAFRAQDRLKEENELFTDDLGELSLLTHERYELLKLPQYIELLQTLENID